MTNQNKAMLTVAAIAVMGLVCFAKVPTLTGKMVAYDPLLHAAKDASFVANKEAVILGTPGEKNKYVKVVFVSFGTSQIDPKYFDGTTLMTVQALRDRACDETLPKFIPQFNPEQSAGTYLLTGAFKNSPPARIKKIECYDATGKK